MKLWYHNPKAQGANNGTSWANAWTNKRWWTVARKFIKFVPLLLLVGCSTPTTKSVSNSSSLVVPPALPQIQSQAVVTRQPMGYGVSVPPWGTLFVYTNGVKTGGTIFFGTNTSPVFTPMVVKSSGRSITVQGSNNLTTWTDLMTTNAQDFYFKFDPKYPFYRTRS